ncbi:MAG: hypothetical protein ACREBD_32410, partial [Blastocatellia bacterium]
KITCRNQTVVPAADDQRIKLICHYVIPFVVGILLEEREIHYPQASRSVKVAGRQRGFNSIN